MLTTFVVMCPMCQRNQPDAKVRGGQTVLGQKCTNCGGSLDAALAWVDRASAVLVSVRPECLVCGKDVAARGSTRQQGLCTECGKARSKHVAEAHPPLSLDAWIERRKAGAEKREKAAAPVEPDTREKLDAYFNDVLAATKWGRIPMGQKAAIVAIVEGTQR